jgi:hypothetical protein
MYMDRIYPPREFAKMVGRSVNTLRRWDREGRLSAKHNTIINKRSHFKASPSGACRQRENHGRKVRGMMWLPRKWWTHVHRKYGTADIKLQPSTILFFNTFNKPI